MKTSGEAASSRLGRMITEVERPRPAPPSPPGQPPSLPPSRKERRPALAIVVVAVLALGVLAVIRWRTRSHQASAGTALRTANVARGDFLRSLRLSGTVEAVQSIAITAPTLAGGEIEQLTITRLVPAGTRVRRGDVLVEFDRQAQIKTFLDKQAEYRDLVSQIASKHADEAAARAKDESDLQQAEDAVQKAQLEMQKNEILSHIDAEKNEETLAEAQANLKQLRNTFDLKRKAAQADLHDLEIQRDRARRVMEHAQENQQKLAIHSPMDGVVVLDSIWRGGTRGEVQEGDQVYPWSSFMQVVDPAAMQVRVKVNQEDVRALNADQAALVRLDAYPALSFPARLQELAPMGETSELSERVRTFTAIYRIKGSDPRLMPDLSAAVDVQLERLPGVLVVPRDSVTTEGGKSYVWVKQSGDFEKRTVEIGAESDLEAVVRSGLRAGDVVLRGKT